MNPGTRALSLMLACAVTLAIPLQAMAQQLMLEEGTPVRLKLIDTLSSGKQKMGDTISFEVADDILGEDGETILVPAGTAAWGTVSLVESRGRIGKKGELSITVDGMKAIDGKKVPLRANVAREGRSKMGSTIALAALLPGGLLWLLRRGKDAVIPAGTRINAYVDRAIAVDIAKAKRKSAPVETPAVSEPKGQPAAGSTAAVPDYLQKYTEPTTADKEAETQAALQALEQLRDQGVLTPQEFEAKKSALLAK